MRIHSVNQKDAAAGLLFMAFGALGLSMGRELELGAAGRMGPGYFPSLISVLLLLVGLFLCGRALWSGRGEIPWGSSRPLISVVAAVLAFGALIEPFGFALATLVLIGLVYVAAWKFRFMEFILLYLILVLGSFLIFVKILAMPLRMIVGV